MKAAYKRVRTSRKRVRRHVFSFWMLSAMLLGGAIFSHPWTQGGLRIAPLDPIDYAAFVKKYNVNDRPQIRPPRLTSTTLQEGLHGVDGLVMDPYTGSIYYSEENLNRIVRLDPDGVTEVVVSHETPVMVLDGTQWVRATGLRAPEGIAFDPAGYLYVVEDIPGGRLLRYPLRDYHRNTVVHGRVVPMPAPSPDYAWESVALGPNGELLVAGSNVEGFIARSGETDVFSGAILYRDADGAWWMPLFQRLESYSGVCFDPEGMYAYFTSEIMGDIGCIDLGTRVVRTWYADITITSPESVTALSDGTAVVAAEGGKLYWINPTDSRAVEVYDFKQDIETVVWDPARNRLLVSSDGGGRIVTLTADVYLNTTQELQRKLPFDKADFGVPIPETCPDYLNSVLNLCGFDPATADPSINFTKFAKNVSLFAIDGETTLLPLSDRPDDPVVRVQFVIFKPRFFGVDLSDLAGPVSGFVAVHASGKITRTRMHDRTMMVVDLWEGKFSPFTPERVALPHPMAARLTPEGTASVSFMGFGEAPDFHVILNMKAPSQSYMVVMHLDGTSQEYRIRVPDGKTLDHWIIAMHPDARDAWTRLEQIPNLARRN